MNRHRLIVEVAALVRTEPNAGARRAELLGRYPENSSAALETLVGVEFVAQELGGPALARLVRRHRELWLRGLDVAVRPYTNSKRKRAWPAG